MANVADFEASELITALCLEAGRIMEDESPALAMSLPNVASEVAARLAAIRRAGEDIVALAAAAEVIIRRGSAST